MSLITKSLAASAMLLAAGCQVKKTQDVELPDVKIEGGQLPKFEVKTPNIRIRLDSTRVVVPKVERGPR